MDQAFLESLKEINISVVGILYQALTCLVDYICFLVMFGLNPTPFLLEEFKVSK